MLSWSMVLLLFCALLAGCGRGKMATKKPPPPVPAPEVAQEEAVEVQQESLNEQLSQKRLEELYAKAGLRGQDAALEAELKKWDQALKTDVPVATNKEVKAYLVYFTTERKHIIRQYLARSTRYLPLIREIFQEHGLPEDLAYLAMIESGFNPYAYSPAQAGGMWQFIPGTARRYGLNIDSYVDERRDPVKATHAAAKYLLDLYKQFGSWYLAAASYNCGEGRVQREIDASTHQNFWDLSANQCLPTETKNYVPQMIAATIIAKNPEKFGFTRIPYLPPLQFDTVKVSEPTSVQAVSIACNVPREEISLLNPELRKGVTPPETYVLKIPKNSKPLFERNIQIARIEAPAPSAAAQIASTYWSSYSRKEYSRTETAAPRETYSKKETTRAPEKTVSRTAAPSKNRVSHTTQAHKGKSGREPEASVHVAAMLPGAKSSRTAKAGKASSENDPKKSNQKNPKKKAATQSANSEKPKTALSRPANSKAAGSPKKAANRKKPVQTAAKPRNNNS